MTSPHPRDCDRWATAWDWWQELVNFERRSAQCEDLKLQRMNEILEALGNPHVGMKCLHVAGTKGKGSTCAFLDSILRASNHTVGLFTSPHLESINERFVVNGNSISQKLLADSILEVRDATDRSPGEPPTFFEVATAVGFLHFHHANVDWTVLETGLGGRLDSTNICIPTACAITSISLDHVRQLGDTVELIAFEKAGIIKPGVPVVSGVRETGPAYIIRKQAEKTGAPLWEIDQEIVISNMAPVEIAHKHGVWSFDLKTPLATRHSLVAGLPGRHQVDNAALAVAMLDSVNRPLDNQSIHQGLLNVVWPGRIETISKDPWVVLDTAHNVASVHALIKTLAQQPITGRRHLIFAASQDKDISGMLALLAGNFDTIHLTRYSGGTRASTIDALVSALPTPCKAKVILEENPVRCLESLISSASPSDLICITGSVFLAGDIRPWLMAHRDAGKLSS
jgi:dihydrofolate synthase/folylpolyglutamate synthase